ncbi:DNA N-glycosylase and apurinic/apyrimidinic (AP) lyase [Tulasnella sp. 418]|nr:DNA N-glycosylase and apurinic/apyrimidinic (AP) lyase [Tulasnella sp. 418]
MAPEKGISRGLKRDHDGHISEAMIDIEDAAPTQKKLPASISALAYSTPSSSTRSKRIKVEETDNHSQASYASTSAAQSTSNLSHAMRSQKKMAQAPEPRDTGSSSPRKKKIQMELEVPLEAPPKWQEVYDLIKQMRDEVEAPVDSMGCAAVMRDEPNPKSQRFGTLVSLMLSSQTKDEVTAQAVANLRATLPGGLNVEGILAADDELIQNAICKVGFWRRKSTYLKQTAQRLKDDFDSEVPQTVDDLCSLPGVGPKMAFLVLQVAWNLNLGIGVDVHVHRITNRLGWHKKPTATPEQTRLNLQSWLPKSLHKEINPLLVGFGQMICLPVKPKCDACLLSERGLCPSAKRGPVTGKTPVKRNEKPNPVMKTVEDLIAEEGLVKVEDSEDRLDSSHLPMMQAEDVEGESVKIGYSERP